MHDCTLYARYALLTGEKRFWDAVVALPSVLFCVSREKFLPLLEQWPEYIDHFLEVCPTAGDTRLQSRTTRVRRAVYNRWPTAGDRRRLPSRISGLQKRSGLVPS